MADTNLAVAAAIQALGSLCEVAALDDWTPYRFAVFSAGKL